VATSAQPLSSHPPLPAPRDRALLLDLFERALIGGLGIWFAYRLFPHATDCLTNLLLMISPGISALIIIIRRPGPAATGSYIWTIALIATFGSMLFHPGGIDLISPRLAIGLMTAGLLLDISAKIVLRRSFGLLPANRGVQTEGPYQLVRHPIYLGYLITEGAFLLVNVSAHNLLVFAMGWMAMVLRIMAEERFLSQDPEYRAYRGRVRFRLIPGLW
jgi:protein-S-isoprenylcysteine O-methyltransferase Ste14